MEFVKETLTPVGGIWHSQLWGRLVRAPTPSHRERRDSTQLRLVLLWEDHLNPITVASTEKPAHRKGLFKSV